MRIWPARGQRARGPRTPPVREAPRAALRRGAPGLAPPPLQRHCARTLGVFALLSMWLGGAGVSAALSAAAVGCGSWDAAPWAPCTGAPGGRDLFVSFLDCERSWCALSPGSGPRASFSAGARLGGAFALCFTGTCSDAGHARLELAPTAPLTAGASR